jgi:sugar O-acyltransferase (sialic acid O-acetyltransferase NeuD family)
MIPKKVIILGGIGNGTVIAHALKDANIRGEKEWVMAGFLNDRLEVGYNLEGFPVLGRLKDIQNFIDERYYFINVIYRIDGQDSRIKLFEDHNIPDEQLATFIHPTAYVAQNIEIGPGCVLMPNVSISPGVKFGKCCLVMVSATIGHNSTIGDHCHFAANSCVGSCVSIGNGSHVGLNATIREEVQMAESSTLAMGSLLLENCGEYEVWAGVPAKLLRMAQRELS